MRKNYTLKLIVFLITTLSYNLVSAASFRSVQTGDWDDASTWRQGAGAGGTEGIDYPAPTDDVYISSEDTVYLGFGTTGSLYEFEGYMEVDSGGIFWITVGTNTTGLALINDARLYNRGQVYTARANEGPGTVGPVEIDMYLEDNAIYYAYTTSYNYCADDVHIRDNAIFYVEVDVCVEIDDDIHLSGNNSLLCGDGGASIGTSTANNDVVFESGATTNNICNGLTVFRGPGGTCNPSSGTAVVTGTGPTNIRPRAVDDAVDAVADGSTSIFVLTSGTDDTDVDGDTLEIIFVGSNAAINNNSTTQGGGLAINNNGTPLNFLDDFVTYTAPASYTGSDSFQYIIEDEDGARDTALVTISVGCGPMSVLSNMTSYPATVTSQSGVGNNGNITGAPDGSFARWYQNGDIMVLDFGSIQLAGTQYEITWRERNGQSGTASLIIEESTDNSSYTTHSAAPTTNSTAAITSIVTSENDFRYLRISKDNPPSSTDWLIDAVGIVNSMCLEDSDNDGIADAEDLDDDNDGILDTDEVANCTGSLRYEFYDGTPTGNTVDNIPTIGALGVGLATNFDVGAIQVSEDPGDSETYGIRFVGNIFISAANVYTFYTNSDDGSKLFIDGMEIVDNDGLHGPIEASGDVTLSEGIHTIEVSFFENTVGEELSVSYESSSISKTAVPFSILSYCDQDEDGIQDKNDLDSDNDGIADLIEAGGVDADGDGQVDVFVDTDMDGWANLFDSDDGGTALADADTDGDGLENRLDIDSDGDGIVDIIESQISGTLVVPSGSDNDNDGIDDNFDTDNGNTLTEPVNSDGSDLADYVDSNSDNDGSVDIIEAWDTDYDGVPNTFPAGVDADNDGLDDNFDLVSGINATTNVTNGGQSSSSFPNNGNPLTAERDWREVLDSDNDGVPDADDLDIDNDGILNVDENCFADSIDWDSQSYPSSGITSSFNTEHTNVSVSYATANLTSITINNDQSNTGGLTPAQNSLFQLPNFSSNAGFNQTQLKFDGAVGDLSFTIFDIDYANTSGAGFQDEVTVTGYINGIAIIPSATGSANNTVSGNTVTANTSPNGTGGTSSAANASFTFTNEIDSLVIDHHPGPNSPGTNPNQQGISIHDFNFNACGTDTDGDGITDDRDLDSDNDGIADIVEAGGLDADGDGIVDDITDSDGDGLADVFDTDDGGTAIADDDFDADGIVNRLDIDSDNDGIIDLIESQASTATPIIPSGTDANGNGIDDNFDPEFANSLITPVNTDGTDNPDYLDTDSDNDLILDITEAYDTNGDGIADTSPANADTDNDGLDDNFDNVVGPNATTNVTNNGQTSNDFPNNEDPVTAELDWRETIDSDGDGISDRVDTDDDNDGIPDYIENVCVSDTLDWDDLTYTSNPQTFNSNGRAITLNSSTIGSISTLTREISTTYSGGLSPVQNNYRTLMNLDDKTSYHQIVFDFDNEVENLRFTIFDIDDNGTFDDSITVIGYTQQGAIAIPVITGSASNTATGNTIAGDANVGSTSAAGNGFVQFNREVDSVVIFYQAGKDADANPANQGIGIHDLMFDACSYPDSDGDGIEDRLDLDSDNDGIADIIEAGGIDSDDDGRVDDNTDSDNDGLADIFDTDDGGTALDDGDADGDGVNNRVDIDSDNDGIPDLVEAGGVDADNDGVVDDNTDTDNDGIADTFDPDNSGTPLAITNTDGVGSPNYLDIDSDDDGIVDIIELQASGTLIIPSGIDSDGDGLDDAFDADDGGTLLVAVDTDIDGIPDYIDLNSDGDTESDYIEGYDTDGDGVADTAPTAIDSDGDGLLDGFDLVIQAPGNASTTNVTNTQDYTAFPNISQPGSFERDWREEDGIDSDNDGVSDHLDADSDNDGILDRDEGTCANPAIRYASEVPQAFWTLDNTTNDASGNGNNERSDGNAPPYSTTAIQGTHSGNFNGTSHQIRYSQNGAFMESNYTDVSFSAWIMPSSLTGNRIIYEEGGGTNGLVLWLDDDVLMFSARSGGAASQTDLAHPINLELDGLWHHVAAVFEDGDMFLYLDGIADNSSTTAGFTNIPNHSSDGGIGGAHGGGTSAGITGNYAGLMDGVTYSNSDAWSAARIGYEAQKLCDDDGDGVANHLDLDSDNDGIADIIEAGGVDADGDGRVDGVFTDTDGDGYSNTFDTDDGGLPLADADSDGDGVKDRIDIDSDNDGISDLVELGGTDADGDGRADGGIDSDQDGWLSSFDPDEGGVNINFEDLDGDGLSNHLDIDSDSDGITDNVEAQSTAGYRAPQGIDTDNDGIDDEYDSDDGGTAITINNQDGAGNPDFLDTDSDGDGFADWIEGFDDDNSEDALNDFIARANNFETAAGNPLYYVNTDDTDSDGIPNWLEDDDSDGTPNFLDFDNTLYQDTDGDGLVDLFDTDNSGVASNLPDADGDGEYDFRDSDDQISLPIELVSFTASKEGNRVALEWVTLTELNNDYFTIERSKNGENFESILFKEGAGNSSKLLNYQLYDNNPMNGYNYYRLKQTDYDGSVSTHNIEVVKFEGQEGVTKVSLYPNPSNGKQLWLKASGLNEGQYQLQIKSTNGQLVLKQIVKVFGENDLTTTQLSLMEQLPKGVYIVEFFNLHYKTNLKLVVN